MTTDTSKTEPINLPSADDHPAVKMPHAQSTQDKDAVALLTANHSKIKQLFTEYDRVQRLGDTGLKADLAQQLALEVEVHALLKEEIFYPAIKDHGSAAHLVRASIQGQAEASELAARLHGLAGDDADLDSNVTLLRTAIERSIHADESELFPAVRQDGGNLLALYDQLADRKAQLEQDMASSPLRTGTREASGEHSAVGQADS
ncbi:hemerythrin HHE cation binding domain-containing protein [Pseudoduganella lurida]|uniref:Hemerythrin HHE cation binding domain-containing protein n=1 Tax=Pseudoduganella lurida TaxID=1036180 RepID=A0A562RM38_9BURK|nr:hemerythrin domain-containing protein [Pseudoduganella lurida]TWI70107.1 hemerythrin HHE cation binding domain-containing protein [Pseudoduganella lurida]